jgi:hypothetical protein
MATGNRLGASAAVIGLVIALVLLSPSPASADVTGGCTGSADFSADAVGAYTPANDTRGNPIIVPKDDGNVASWEGSVPGENKNFGGKVEIRFGPLWIEVADWGLPDHDGSNDNDERRDDGDYNMDELWDVIPKNIAQGIYEARASHSASSVNCQANFFVKFEGSALSSPIVIGALVLLAGFLAMLVPAGRRTGKLGFFRGRPLLAVIAGLLASPMLALILQQFSVWPLDNVTTIGLPIVMVVLGLLLAKLAPLGGSASAPLADLTGPGSGDDEIFTDGFESGDTSAWTDDG